MFKPSPTLSNKKGSESLRRAVHFSFGFAAFAVPFLGREASLAIAAAAFLYNAWLAPALRLDRGYRREGEGRFRGLATYPLAVFLVLLPPLPLAVGCGAWAVLAAGDPCAALAGSRRPSPRLPWNRGKSVAGSVTGAAAAFLFALPVLRVAGVADPLLPAASAAAAGLLAEGLPLPVDDNLLVAFAAALALLPFLA